MIVFAEKYSPPVLIFVPSNVNPPAVPIVLMLITPDPPPLTVNAPSADNVVVMVKSELPVPFVIVAPAEATVIAVEVRSVVDPKEIVVVPDADRIPKLWAVPSSVEAVALKVNDPASVSYTHLTLPTILLV